MKDTDKLDKLKQEQLKYSMFKKVNYSISI